VQAIKITPDAGTVKGAKARTVPLHAHLIEQGFLTFARSKGKGPLFYSTDSPTKTTDDDPTNPRKRRYVKARERLAAWVRDIGVTDRELQPNHAWRDTFKQIGRRHIDEHLLDAIVGHAPANVGRSYGAPTLDDMADALKRFPRYEL
jgi:integrase